MYWSVWAHITWFIRNHFRKPIKLSCIEFIDCSFSFSHIHHFNYVWFIQKAYLIVEIKVYIHDLCTFEQNVWSYRTSNLKRPPPFNTLLDCSQMWIWRWVQTRLRLPPRRGGVGLGRGSRGGVCCICVIHVKCVHSK